ncbi:MAG: hypothetical protein HAW60_06225 [Bdellovibrionales bacterium]|nr:hypothetical protein [Bdellovibrionales bacterium]
MYNDRPYDKWSIINFASRILLHRNIKKTNKNEALFCSEWNCMVVEELEGIDIPKMLGLKSREYVTPIDFFNGLVLSNKQTR